MADPLTVEALRRWLCDTLAATVGVDVTAIDPTVSFHDVGITSSEAVSLSGELEELLGRELPATLLYEHPTIERLAAALSAEGASEPSRAPGDDGEPRPPAEDAVCVVGLSCRFPGGADTPDRFWRNLLDGVDAATDVPTDRWDAGAYHDPDPTASLSSYTTRGGFLHDVAGFDADFFGISPAEALRMDPQHRLLLESSWSALEDAGCSPDRLRGSATGIFVGMLTNQEYGRLQAERDGAICLDDPHFGFGLAPSVAAGRISYALDLRGPSLTVDTACSSSLLAVHLAVGSLRRGECDLAVAAGASALTHPATMVQACRSRMLAPDGRTKAFDAAADGYLIGEGCGVVVLERLADARAHGHRVLAVVRGSGVNQDGQSNGLTAPNLAAQVAVIRQALADAGLPPGDVDLVEAHGSGTPLGDAIELSALHEVFGPNRDPNRPLVVGAVKTNVGHLLGAAGMAGFIKTVLALQAGAVPPNLHLEAPNPALDADGGVLALPGQVRDWPAREERRVAGVSSFGWSGTNAHIVVASPPPALTAVSAVSEEDTAAAPRCELLPLSARSPAALACAAEQLAAHLDCAHLDCAHLDCAGADLATVARTLQEGRAALDFRLPVLVQDVADARSALEAAARSVSVISVPGATRPAVFLLPGTGDQYQGMAAGLYRTEPVFAAAVDACADALRDDLERDLRDVLLSPACRTEDVHAAVFAVDYAMARLWQSFGVQPAALLGYSLGEYAAACLAGVFSLEDAARLVVRRARLIAAQPPGVMLAAGVAATALTGQLPAGVHLAAINGPSMTVVAGSPVSIDAFTRQLDTRGVAHLPVNTGQPMHTPLLDPMRTELERLVAAVARQAPSVPVISCRSGTWMSAEEAQDPAYWAAQACEPVQFERGLAEVVAEPHTVLLEIGPGQTLTSLATQALAPAVRTDVLAMPTLRPQHALGTGSDREHLLTAVGRYWAAGGRVDWPGVRACGRDSGVLEMVALPTYPFQRQRYWPDGHPEAGSAASGTVDARPAPPASGNEPDLARWCYVPVWTQSPAPRAEHDMTGERWLVCADRSLLALTVIGALRRRGAAVTTVEPGAGFRPTGQDAFSIDPTSRADYAALLDVLDEHRAFPSHVLHAWALAPSADYRQPAANPLARVLAGQEAAFGTLTALARALGQRSGVRPLRITVLTAGMQEVVAAEGSDPASATALGVCRTVGQEFPRLACRSVDLDPVEAFSAAPDGLAELVVGELHPAPDAVAVALRAGRRWVQDWHQVPIGSVQPEAVWRANGSYLITGGFGGLGLSLARQLARRGPVRLALLGRHSSRTAVRELESLGAAVLALEADVADQVAVRAAVDTALTRFGELHGVVHTAGIPASGLLQLTERDAHERVLRPKVTGTVVLHQALREVPVDFFLAYSSAVVALGGLGETDYCAANNFLDAYARHARHDGFPMVTVDWGPWRWDSWSGPAPEGDTCGASPVQQLRARYGITDEEGFELLTRVLAADLPQVLIAQQDLATMAARWAQLSKLVVPAAPERSYPRPQLRTAYQAPRTDLERRVCALWQRYLGLDRVGVEDQFFELGGTSLVGLSIAAELEKELDTPLSGADLFTAPTPADLSRLLAHRQSGGQPDVSDVSNRGQHRRQRAAAAATRRHHHKQGAA